MVEAILFCLVLLIPVAWGMAVLEHVHRAALASTAAARDAGFVAVRSTTMTSAGSAIDRTVAAALLDQGLQVADADVAWSAPRGLERDARIDVVVSYRVPVLGSWLPFASVRVSARHSAFVPRYSSRDA